MSDHDFERRLERLFAQPPRLEGSEPFTAQVEARLERGWGVRRLMVGAAGASGGVIAATQMMNAEVVRRIASVSLPAELFQVKAPESWTFAALDSAAMSGEVVWVTAGLLGLAVAFAATRWAEGF